MTADYADHPQFVEESAPPPPYDAEPVAAAEEPQAQRRRWRFAPSSLTGRLVAGVVALVVVLVLATGAATYYALRSFLVNRLDQQVTPIAGANQHAITQCLASSSADCALFNSAGGPFRAPQTEWMVVLDSTGAVQGHISSSSALRQMDLSADQRRAIVANPPSAATLHTTDGVELRVSARPITLPTGDSFVVVSGLSTSDVTHTLHRLLNLELIIGAAAAVLAFGATAYGVRFSLRHLYGVTQTAHEVAAELSPEGAGLDRRVEVSDPDTEVGRLAESMNTLLSAVETQFAARVASEDRMRQFLADASHELRTPLTSIRGYAELGRLQRAQGQQSDDAGNLDRIESEGKRMSRLVDDLLTLARSDQAAHAAEDGTAQESVDVGELLADAVDGARAAHPGRSISATAPSGLIVQGDRDQLMRVISNLVRNAAIHTRSDGPIETRAFRDGAWAVVQVIDSGPGLPPEDAARVFERFWRADKSRTRGSGGSGLGMSIVASLVQAHGGEVRFDSSVSQGSTVTVWLPLGPA